MAQEQIDNFNKLLDEFDKALGVYNTKSINKVDNIVNLQQFIENAIVTNRTRVKEFSTLIYSSEHVKTLLQNMYDFFNNCFFLGIEENIKLSLSILFAQGLYCGLFLNFDEREKLKELF